MGEEPTLVSFDMDAFASAVPQERPLQGSTGNSGGSNRGDSGDAQGNGQQAQNTSTVTLGTLLAPDVQETTETKREKTRAGLAYLFASLFTVTILGALFAAATGYYTSSMAEVLKFVLPAQTAVLGTALGFYFGVIQGQGGP
jgi:hypothetical protein